MSVDRCPRCAAAVRPGDPWCTQCYADLRPAPAVVAAAADPDPLTAPLEVLAPATVAAPAPATPPAPARPRPGWTCHRCGTASPYEDLRCSICGAGALDDPAADAGLFRLAGPAATPGVRYGVMFGGMAALAGVILLIFTVVGLLL